MVVSFIGGGNRSTRRKTLTCHAYRKTFRLPQENGDITDMVRKQISNDHF
jgi:hypothetical protein